MNAAPRMLLPFVVALLLVPLTACALSGKAIEGKVLEEGANKPVPEAIVIARWSGHLATFAHGKTVCYHVLSTTTDENGAYRFPAWKKEITEDWQKNVQPETVIITVHKPGYEEYRAPGYAYTEEFKRNIRYLQPFAGTREERLKYLRRMSGATSCGSARESEKNLYPLIKAIYEESKQIAKTDFEKYVAAGFEHSANSLLLPPDKRISMPYPHREKSELLKAIEDNNIARAKALLAGGADPNDRANDGATMLMTAIRYGYSEMAMLLLENRADPNAITFDDQNLTAMDQLIYRNQDRAVAYAGKIAALMVQKGYDIGHRDVSGKTALEKATQHGARSAERNAEIIKVLKEHTMRDK